MSSPLPSFSLAQARCGLAALALWAAAGGAQAQFAMVPDPLLPASPQVSDATEDKTYRKHAARHIYAAFPNRVHKGKLPPMMYAVMITDTKLDASGNVVEVDVVRGPAAAKEVTPWVVSLIRKASPFPAPAQMGEGGTVYREIWLVDRTGKFQVDSLTEGQ